MKTQLEYSCFRLLSVFLTGMCTLSFAGLVHASLPIAGEDNVEAAQGYSDDLSRIVLITDAADSIVDRYIPSDSEDNMTTVRNTPSEILGVVEAVNTDLIAIALHEQGQVNGTVLNNQVQIEAQPMLKKTISSDSQTLPTSSVPNPELHIMLLVGLGLIVLSLRRRTHFTHR